MSNKALENLIGNTPLAALEVFSRSLGLPSPLLAKCEFMNPGGSSKDRVALAMLNSAEAQGLLKPGGTVIEPTSGNTGIGLASLCAARGYRLILTMPETMSLERRQLLAAYGAQLVLTPGSEGMSGSVQKALQLKQSIPGSLIAGQFDNCANPDCHEATTGPEIWRDAKGRVDIFVAGVGTGGTLTGVGRYLRRMNPCVELVAVEPADSPLLSQGRSGSHGIEGIGANFIPSILDRTLIDEVFPVELSDAYEMARLLARREGLLAGKSSGAALHAAARLALRRENAGKTVVVLLPDRGERYLSTPLFD